MKKLLSIVLILLFVSCNLFDKQERLTLTVKSNDGKIVKLYYVTLGATTNDVIQVRKVDGDKETLVKAYVHNFVNTAKFVAKDSFIMVLSDTTSYGSSKKRDTVKLLIK